MTCTGFLSEFPPVPTADWEKAIRESVAGPDYPAKLTWRPEEGLAVRPYYRAEDLAEIDFREATPGEFPYVRSNRATGNWRVREAITAVSPEEANRCAIDVLAAGAEEIEFHNVSVTSPVDVALLLANLRHIPVRFCGLNEQTTRIVVDWFRAHPHSGEVSADIDPLADPAFSAELCVSQESRLLTISAEDYEERGAGSIEQVAFALSTAVEFLDTMLGRGVCIDRAAMEIGFSFAIGPHFLVEIAKLRAFRLAWARVVEGFGGCAPSANPVIFARTARWNETVYDPHANVLRATTEAISAVLGGADSLAVSPFDACYRQPDQASQRLARSVQLILKHEAQFARVADPLGGAYAIEVLTNAIASEAWKMFREIEAAGGYRKAKADGIFESIFDRRAADRDTSANRRQLALIGTNRFANPGEKALDRLHAHQPNRSARVARGFEEVRFRTERAATTGRVPKIVLGEFGDPRMRTARAQFAAEFLGCAGLTANVRHVRDPLEAAESDADLIVLCSSDSEYLTFADELMPLVAQRKHGTLVAIAGNPESAEQLKRIGIEEFIHRRSDSVEVLTRLQQKLGIEA